MTQSKLGITPGEWIYEGYWPDDEWSVMPVMHKAQGQDVTFIGTEADARLIAEAGTVCNRTGLTPGELVELIADLVDLHENGYPESDHAAALWNKARSITSTESHP